MLKALHGINCCLASFASHEDPESRPGIASADDLIRGDHNLGFPNVAEGEFFFDDRNRLGGLAVQGVSKLDGNTDGRAHGKLPQQHPHSSSFEPARLKHIVDKV